MVCHMRKLFAAPSQILALCLVLGLTGCGFFASQPKTSPPDSIRTHKLVKTAYTQMGKRYRAGGSSPRQGFDCSGLVWWAYKQNGIKVPRITADQARAGRKISKKSARPGDILVFRTSRSPRGLHTGIYCGEGKFIHSPSSGKNVCLERLSHPYWGDRLIAVRRVR